MTPIAYIFLKLKTAKEMVRKMSKKPRFKTPFDSQHPKGYQTLLRSAESTFTVLFNHPEAY